MTDFVTARDKWAGMTVEERKGWIRQVNGDVAVAVDDWAALPPQAQTALIATMQPEPTSETEATEEPSHGRRKRGE